MPLKYTPGVLSVTLTALRRRRGLTEKDLAEQAGISDSMITYYETEKEPSREKLYELAALLGYSVEDVESIVFGLSRVDRPLPESRLPVDPTPAGMRQIREIAGRAGRGLTELIEKSLAEVARSWRIAKARRRAGELWQEIQKTPVARRRALIETSRKFQTWEVAERLAEESARAASDRADRALELAELGLRAAELAPGDPDFMAAVKGFALVFLANARRVANQIPAAGQDCDRGVNLWESGAPEARKILPAWRVPDLEASLRRDQRRFPEALKKLEEARALAPPQAVARILVKRAVTLEHMGEAEQAIEVLREADSSAKEEQNPELILKIRFNTAANLCHLDRYVEALSLLPEIRQLAVAGRKELNLLRVLWVSARIQAGLGEVREARAAFDQVRRAFRDRLMAADYALATLERAVLDLQDMRYGEVQALAEEMKWIFKAEGLHREELAALALFRRAVAEEWATPELARRIVQYLHRAQYDPELVFEG
jgi:transcriptional regulator with XRE-family HTH domain